MKRRLDLAVSMIERPALLFLDEPTTGLDPRSREQVWATVSQLRAEGVTILLTTQYLEEADRLADLVGVLDGGRIVAEGTPEQLKSTVGAEQVRLELTDRAAYDAARQRLPRSGSRPDAADDRRRHRRVRHVARPRSSTTAQRHHLDIRRVDTQRPSLDDVFLSLTDRRVAA